MKGAGAESSCGKEAVLAETVADILGTWWAEPLASIPRIDRALVHKRHDENVFVSRLQRVLEGDEDVFATQFVLDPGHSFFFEHPLDHIPGLMLVEAGRQAATAASHLFYGVPRNPVFLLRGLAVNL